MNPPRYALVLTASLLFSGCDVLCGDECYTPPPDHLVLVEAGCNACTPAEATHPCADDLARLERGPVNNVPDFVPRTVCRGIPTARVGDKMLLCANGAAGEGAIGRLEWSSSDSQVATIRPAQPQLPVTHCGGERSNAWFEAKAPGTVNIIVNEFDGGRIATTVAAPVTVLPAVE